MKENFDMKRLEVAMRKRFADPFVVKRYSRDDVASLGWADPPCQMVEVALAFVYVHLYPDGECSMNTLSGDYFDFVVDTKCERRYIAAAERVAEALKTGV